MTLQQQWEYDLSLVWDQLSDTEKQTLANQSATANKGIAKLGWSELGSGEKRQLQIVYNKIKKLAATT